MYSVCVCVCVCMCVCVCTHAQVVGVAMYDALARPFALPSTLLLQVSFALLPY